MPGFTTSMASVLLAATVPFISAPVAPHQVPADTWRPRAGDRLVVDTKENDGYLIHADGRYIRFDVATGQRRFVSYIGRYYNAATPNQYWVAKNKEIKGDRVTFGPTGRFIRFFEGGDNRTAYGIHEYKYEDRMFDPSYSRHGTMGCVVVRKEMMDVIDRTYAINEGEIEVVTEYGIDDQSELVSLFENRSKEIALND